MSESLKNLIEAEAKASQLFDEIEKRQIIKAGKTEKDVNTDIFKLAFDMFGIEKYWHKRIVRSGENTLRPYDDNPPNLVIQPDDIVFLDFGPIFEDWEADFGRTFVLGHDAYKIKLKTDIETAWYEVKDWFHQQTELTASTFYNHITKVANNYGWEYGGEIGGHLIGQFPHEKIESNNYGLYIHPENNLNMFTVDAKGNKRHWILEIHFVDKKKKIGGFFEQLLC
ncbi:M24 family metallopeptidase [Paucihalobacter sp.]|uniref:M24 family metallopeptidase n=1 Tax=Paucihalobacter sp. TaxID=2850405 RepID=UPI002FE2EED8